MPRGLAKIKQVASEAAARQAAYDEAGPGIRFFSIDDGKSAKVRFLEQGNDVWYNWTHQLPRQQGQEFGDSVMCLDQDDQGSPCPGCARGLSRTARVTINLIWYDAPKFDREPGKDGNVGKIKKDSNGHAIIIGTEDCVAVWNASQTVGGRLAHLHEKLEQVEGVGGLMGAIIDVTRQGTKKNTKYMVDIDVHKAPTPADHQLYKSKGDPRNVLKQLSYGDMERAYSGGGVAAGNAPEAGQGSPDMEGNAFAAAATGSAINRGAFG